MQVSKQQPISHLHHLLLSCPNLEPQAKYSDLISANSANYRLHRKKKKIPKILRIAMEGNKVEGSLVQLCIEAASESTDSVEIWRRKRRTLERMPSELAEALFRRLLRRRLVSPSLLE